ncbi:MAG TPA: protein kinase, partial [Umezawaea sp.]|nr:protein kinase [Umezawaea sp.]
GGGAKLADFGIARAMDDPRLTATGSMMGTPGYMAPELFNGQVPSPATDLWALGATLFHAVEGRSPFLRDTTASTMHAVLYEPPVLKVGTGPLAAVIMRLLTRATDTRPTAAQVREMLRKPGEPETVFIEPVTSYATRPVDTPPWADDEDPPAEEKPNRRKVFLIAGAAATVVALALAGVFLVKPHENGKALPGPVAGTTSSTAPSSSAAESSAPSSESSAPTTSATPSTVTVTKEPEPPVITTTEPVKPPPDSVALQRFRNAAGFHYSGTAKVTTPAGFTVEGGIGKLLANADPGTKPLYSCAIKNSQDRMSSLAANCEGQSVLGLLGYVLADKPADLPSLPLYRCNAGAHHFDSVTTGCEGQTVEFQYGWVLN